LSCGESLTGYHAGEPCGSLTTNAPSSVGTQPSIELSGSVTTLGVPLWSIVTVKLRPERIPVDGVITSSCSPARAKVAAAPSTSSREIVKPRRSRSKRERFWVALASMTAVPVS
jgi:hypothetical protein